MDTIIPNPNCDYKVIIKCFTYNHQNYIEDALKGFVMQKTNFPFCAIVVDDFSTDSTVEIIKKYEEQYPNIIKGIYLQENYYSQGKSKEPFFKPWFDRTKYIALCEGDDYWTDENKLQKQIDWLDFHPEYSMCCTDAIVTCNNIELDWHRFEKDSDITPEQMILGGGFYIQTATIVYKKEILNFMNEAFIRLCSTGDYSLQIMCSIKGKVRYLSEKTAVYRYQNPGSWSSNNKNNNIERLIKYWRSVLNMLDGFDDYTNGKYSETIKLRKINFITEKIIKYYHNRTLLNKEFNDILSLLSYKQKIVFFIKKQIYVLKKFSNLAWII